MLKRFLTGLFRGRPVVVPNSEQLADGEARGVNLGDLAAGGRRVLLCRVDGEVHAIDSLCPHKGARIESGALVDGRFARCPLHNFLFDPKTGKPVQGACRAATVYRVVEKDGRCELYA